MYLVGSILAGLIAIGCLIAGINALLKQRRERAQSVAGEGPVTGLQRRVLKPGSASVYCPTVEYATPNGEHFSFESAFGSMPAAYQVGQAVKIRYNPSQPGTAEVDSGLSRWLAPGCFLAFAMGGCAFSVLFLILFMVVSRS